MCKFFRVFVLLITLCEVCSAQEDSVSKTGVVVASILPAGVIGGALYQNYSTWWKTSEHSAFHFSNDPPYAYHNDKFGHAFFTTLSADIIRRGYLIAGVDSRTATWLGSGSALLAQTLVEIEDGFHSGTDYFGFSPGDEVADILGASLPLLQEYIPYMRNFKYKLSIFPSEAYKLDAYSNILDDNESQTFWISANIHSMTEVEWTPSWLNLAVGYGVENLPSASFLSERVGKKPSSLLFLGLDLNFSGLPIKGKVWEVIAEILDHFHVPLPALQFGPKVKAVIR